MDTFWEYFSVLAPSVGLGLIFWLVMRSLFRADSGERNARSELEEREAQEWARLRDQQGASTKRRSDDGGTAADRADDGGTAVDPADDGGTGGRRPGSGVTS